MNSESTMAPGGDEIVSLSPVRTQHPTNRKRSFVRKNALAVKQELRRKSATTMGNQSEALASRIKRFSVPYHQTSQYTGASKSNAILPVQFKENDIARHGRRRNALYNLGPSTSPEPMYNVRPSTPRHRRLTTGSSCVCIDTLTDLVGDLLSVHSMGSAKDEKSLKQLAASVHNIRSTRCVIQNFAFLFCSMISSKRLR